MAMPCVENELVCKICSKSLRSVLERVWQSWVSNFIAFMKCVVIGAVLAQNGDDAFFIVA